MLRLRCYLFGKLIRERRDRVLDASEREFLDRHRLECIDCRIREATTGCSLDVLSESKLSPSGKLSSKVILEKLQKGADAR